MTTYTSKNGTISITDEVSGGYSSESKIPCNAKDRNGEFKNVLLDCLNMTKRIVELETQQARAEILIHELHEQVYDNRYLDNRVRLYEVLKEPKL
jgi:hypothetical protein